MTDTLCDAAIEILRATTDGDALAPSHLALVQLAVNDRLNDAGKLAFYELLANVRSGYRPPWFHDVPHMTIDHQGYVRWKGTAIEHFSCRYAYTADAKDYVRRLAAQRIALETNES